MATTSATSGTSNIFASATSSSTNAKTIANNFDQFLTLLTTQLKNQSPLDPLDTNQFTQQLVQFASVEQQIKSNETLNALLSLTKATTATNALSYVGATITADGTTTRLASGKAQWALDSARAGTAVITIKDKSGNVVATTQKALAAGEQAFVWDGRTSTGAAAPEGDYTIAVSARDLSGAAISVKTEVRGVVDKVDLSGDVPVLQIGGLSVAIDKVKSITRE